MLTVSPLTGPFEPLSAKTDQGGGGRGFAPLIAGLIGPDGEVPDCTLLPPDGEKVPVGAPIEAVAAPLSILIATTSPIGPGTPDSLPVGSCQLAPPSRFVPRHWADVGSENVRVLASIEGTDAPRSILVAMGLPMAPGAPASLPISVCQLAPSSRFVPRHRADVGSKNVPVIAPIEGINAPPSILVATELPIAPGAPASLPIGVGQLAPPSRFVPRHQIADVGSGIPPLPGDVAAPSRRVGSATSSPRDDEKDKTEPAPPAGSPVVDAASAFVAPASALPHVVGEAMPSEERPRAEAGFSALPTAVAVSLNDAPSRADVSSAAAPIAVPGTDDASPRVRRSVEVPGSGAAAAPDALSTLPSSTSFVLPSAPPPPLVAVQPVVVAVPIPREEAGAKFPGGGEPISIVGTLVRASTPAKVDTAMPASRRPTGDDVRQERSPPPRVATAPTAAVSASVAPVILPALQAFGTAMRQALADERMPIRLQSAAESSPIGGTATNAVVAAPPVTLDSIMLDTADRRWPHAMAEQIERLRDAAAESNLAPSTRIRLFPDALGPVDVSVRRDGAQVLVHFTAAQAETRQLLADAQPRLADAAEARGLKLGRTDVSGGDLTDASQQQSQQQRPTAPAPRPSHPAPARVRADAVEDPDNRLA